MKQDILTKENLITLLKEAEELYHHDMDIGLISFTADYLLSYISNEPSKKNDKNSNYEKLISDKQYLIDFFDEYCCIDNCPWINWFDKNYCQKCQPILEKNKFGICHKYSYCEKNQGKCKYFDDKQLTPKDIIGLWLDKEG